MKRIIKFRVFDNVDYMATFTLQDLQDSKIVFTSDCPVMQFTGLTDKNGVEIYESDIVLICHDFKGRTNRGKIIFKDGKFQLEGFCMTHLDNPNDFTECLEYATVIGNIHTTPELITTP